MKTRNGEDIKDGDLISIIGPRRKSERYFYVQEISSHESNIFYGLKVNKDYTFNKKDKEDGQRAFIVCSLDEIKCINPVPEAFKESLRTLHFWVDEILDNFGAIKVKKIHVLFRAVKFENGSYGIIQNQMYHDMSGIDYSHYPYNLFEDLSYEELCEIWETKKENRSAEWIQEYR